MKNNKHSELQKEWNYNVTEIVYYLDECKSTKKLLGIIYNKSIEYPNNEWLKRQKEKVLCNLLYYRKILLSLQQQVISLKRQIKQTQRDNQKLNY